MSYKQRQNWGGTAMIGKDIAIKVENVSKYYRIGYKEETKDTVSGTVVEFIKSPLKNYRKYRSLYRFDDVDETLENDSGNNNSNIILASKNISFEVKTGEVVGIIGRNGSGKSTLLKILSKITHPNKGRIYIRGRISSLLEVGTGFHPELTGRENVYLNGTILGMRKQEIDRKFDEIVDFSGVEKFLDTPVKRYSSGMKVRLAFSVAAHLEPEILLIDEVLAVGDAEFQKKCLKKMEGVGQEGRTVIFVSHNMSAVTRLCQRTILMDSGTILEDGRSDQVVNTYLSSGSGSTAHRRWENPETAPGNDVVRLRACSVVSENGEVCEILDIRKKCGLRMEFEVLEGRDTLLPYYNVFDQKGIRVFPAVDLDPDWRGRYRPPGRYICTAWIPGNLLSEGRLFVGPSVKDNSQKNIKYFYVPEAIAFMVVDSMEGDSARGDYVGRCGGAVRPLFKWETKFSPQ